MTTPLQGARVLIVEDEAAVALMIEDMLADLGCEIAASAAQLSKAVELARSLDCDFAILDVNLGGRPVFPVAGILRERKIPFVFSTGYGRAGLPEEFQGEGVLNKPFAIDELGRQIAKALAAKE
jgi:CheY-like chemotaxis protein